MIDAMAEEQRLVPRTDLWNFVGHHPNTPALVDHLPNMPAFVSHYPNTPELDDMISKVMDGLFDNLQLDKLHQSA